MSLRHLILRRRSGRTYSRCREVENVGEKRRERGQNRQSWDGTREIRNEIRQAQLTGARVNAQRYSVLCASLFLLCHCVPTHSTWIFIFLFSPLPFFVILRIEKAPLPFSIRSFLFPFFPFLFFFFSFICPLPVCLSVCLGS